MSAWLQDWLQELNLMEYYPLLLKQRLTSPEVVAHLDKNQLMEHGVTKVGHLNRLNNAIMKLATSYNVPSPTNSNLSPTESRDGSPFAQSRSNPSSPLSTSRENIDKFSTLPVGGSITRVPPTSNAPPVPMRRSTKKRSQSPSYTMSVTEDMLMSKELSPVRDNNRLSPQHAHSRPVSRNISDSSINMGIHQRSLPTSPSFSPTRSLGGNSSGSESSSRVTSPQHTRSPSPRRSGYENVGPNKQQGGPPKPPPRLSSYLSTKDEDTLSSTSPPLLPNPPQTRGNISDLPSLPKVTSYEEILDREVWSGESVNETQPQVDSGDYACISDVVLSPALTQYEEITPNTMTTTDDRQSPSHVPDTTTQDGGGDNDQPPPPAVPRRVSIPPSFVPPTPPIETSPSPPPGIEHPPIVPRRASMSGPQPPIVPRRNSLSNQVKLPSPMPPKETSPPPSTLPDQPSSFTDPLPPLPNFIPPPPPSSSDYYELKEEYFEPESEPLPTEGTTSPPPPPKPRPSVPSRKSSLPASAEPLPLEILSQPPPPFTPSPPPSVNEEEESMSPLPPPVIPKRGTLNLPPPPPPPITYEDHPEGLMEDPETYITSHNNVEDSPASDASTAGSSPLTVPMRISQLSSGSESSIGLTPPTERASFINTQSDSDTDGSGSSPHTTSNASTLTMRSTLEPLKEDTLLGHNSGNRHTYESVSPPPPVLSARPRPKSTLIEEKKNTLFAKQNTTPRDNLSMSYNSFLEDTPTVKKSIPVSQSVKNLAKDLEKQTLRQSVALQRSRTDSDVSERQASTISPNKFRNSMFMEEEVPQTAEGFLHKKGGKRNERPYQKRWVVFDGEVLKYFKQKGVKEMDARNNVKLSEMIDVKRVADPDQTNRFDLVVINRVFQFYADTEDNTQLWVNVLHAAITKFNPSDNDDSCKEGGNMNNPDKQGFLMKQGHGRFAASGFKQRYVALKESRYAYYDSKEDFISGKPIHILDMRLANVRPDMTGKAPRFTITMPNQRSYVFQANTSMEQREWIEKLQEAILNALNLAPETKEGKKGVKAADILARIQENPSNKICADCDSEDPSWAIINRGIMVCIECSGVHRSMGVHISKVRSVELDVEIWTETLIQLFQTIGNANSNTFWEKYCQSKKLESTSPREIRETLIRAKYESKSWIPRSMGDTPEVLSKALCVSVASDDLMRTTELLVTGADPCFAHPDIQDTEKNTPIKIAKANGKFLQVELLEQNGALLDSSADSSQVSSAYRKGYLSKTGSERKGWKERYCTINGYRGLEYFKSETDVEILGAIKVDSMLGATHCEVDGAGKDKHCFEVITPSRAYLFAAESAEDMHEWLATIKEIIPKDNADKLGFDKVGFLSKRSPQNVGWKKRWFSLKDKKLTYFKKEEIASIDMKSITSIKPPEQGSFETMCSFQIVAPDRVYHLRADNPAEADSWVQALKQTQVSVPLSEHPLTSGSNGTGIPVLVHKCLQFVEAQGLELEGIYRISGQKPKIINLLQQFTLDPRTVVLDDSEYCVHDVTGTLKKFLKSLPDPLLTHQLYQAFLDAAVMSDHETKLHQLQSLIDQLPPVNKETLKRIISHLLKVVHHESCNKMSKSNLTSLFGPTLMSVDGDPVNFPDMQSQYSCIEHMMSYYEWLFNATGEEEKKEEAMQEALKKLEAAKEQHKQQAQVASGMNTSTSFLISVYINDKQDDVCGMKVTLTTTAAEVVEFVTSTRSLPPTNYCVYLVLGESESERPLHSLEQVLTVQTTGSHLCLKKNTLADRIQDYDSYSGQCVMLNVMEKKKWKKYPCAVKLRNFIIFKDNKCQIELHRIPLFDADLFIGIERKNIDVKNPLPTKYPLCLIVRVNNNNKFLCADTVEDRLMISAAVIFSKHPDGIQTPVMPVKTVPKLFDARNRGISILNPLGSGGNVGSNSSYLNFKPNASRTHLPKKNVGDERLLRELTHRQKSTSPDRA